MNEYHKIQTVFLRDKKGKIQFGEWTEPEFEYLAACEWIGTEKIDGTNIRIIWKDGKVEFKGRKEKSTIPKPLLDVLQQKFTPELFDDNDIKSDFTLFGEGYGHKINQYGSNYIADGNDFILFDIMLESPLKNGNRYYFSTEVIKEMANTLGIKHVPTVWTGTLLGAIELIKDGGFKSLVAEDKELTAEGLVLTPKLPVLSHDGKRIITKLKVRDFAHLK